MANQYVLGLLYLIFILCSNQYINANELLGQEEFDASGIDGQQLEDEFNKLNEFLFARVKSSDPEQNFNLVLENYKSRSKSWFKKMSSDSMRARKLFLAMGQITDENRCTPRSYNILIQIDRATFDRSCRRLDPEGVVRRVERILLDYVLKQQSQCHDAHLKQYRDKLASMDTEKVKKVEAFLEPYISSLISEKLKIDKSKSRIQKLYDIINEKSSSISSKNPMNVLESLKHLVKDDPSAKSILQVDDDTELKELMKKDTKIQKLHSQYLFEPCLYYLDQLGPEVFKVVYFENKFQQSLDERNPDFYESWTRYHLCNMFVAQHKYTAWHNQQVQPRGINHFKFQRK